MSSAIGNIGTSASFTASFKQPSDEEILAKIEKDFGKDAIASVTDDEGKLDKAKLEDFLRSKGVQPPQGGGGGGQGNAAGGSQQAGGPSGSGGSSASTEVKSETRQSNPDGSVTTTITYIDGSVEKTTSQPDLEKASDNYKLQHPEKDKKNNDKETESGSLVSIKV
ncbi:MAG: hypothetical protein IPI58_00420 [Alphaproteobacteria bacterium]|nr:MAG: hypothetical protein IPI58_00420 [Alphaproteobacteria bacterium]